MPNEHAQGNLMPLKNLEKKKRQKMLTANKTSRNSFKIGGMTNIVEKIHYSLTNKNGILRINTGQFSHSKLLPSLSLSVQQSTKYKNCWYLNSLNWKTHLQKNYFGHSDSGPSLVVFVVVLIKMEEEATRNTRNNFYKV